MYDTIIPPQTQHMSDAYLRRKAQTATIGGYLEIDYPDRARRIKECVQSYRRWICEGCGLEHVVDVWYCRDRLCPLCSWLRSRELSRELCTVVDYLGPEQPYIMLTLTVRNCAGYDLRATITEMSRAWNKLIHRAALRRVVRGFARATEITYNAKAGTYHPHMHVMLAVKPAAFSYHYIRHDRWVDMWAESLRVDYTPIVDVRRVGSKQYANRTPQAAALECAKYLLKPLPDGLGEAQMAQIYRCLAEEIRGLRMISYGGIMHQARQTLGPVDEEAIPYDVRRDTCDCGETMQRYEIYRWRSGIGYQHDTHDADCVTAVGLS